MSKVCKLEYIKEKHWSNKTKIDSLIKILVERILFTYTRSVNAEW